jgi:hypothetical protein
MRHALAAIALVCAAGVAAPAAAQSARWVSPQGSTSVLAISQDPAGTEVILVARCVATNTIEVLVNPPIPSGGFQPPIGVALPVAFTVGRVSFNAVGRVVPYRGPGGDGYAMASIHLGPGDALFTGMIAGGSMSIRANGGSYRISLAGAGPLTQRLRASC